MTNIKHSGSNEINDIFSFINKDEEKEFIYFPRSMEVKAEDIYDFFKITNNKNQ